MWASTEPATVPVCEVSGLRASLSLLLALCSCLPAPVMLTLLLLPHARTHAEIIKKHEVSQHSKYACQFCCKVRAQSPPYALASSSVTSSTQINPAIPPAPPVPGCVHVCGGERSAGGMRRALHSHRVYGVLRVVCLACWERSGVEEHSSCSRGASFVSLRTWPASATRSSPGLPALSTRPAVHTKHAGCTRTRSSP